MAFKPGAEWKNSGGNPKGRPRAKKSLSEVIRSTIGPQLIARKLKELIEKNDAAALRMAMDFGWAKPHPEFESKIAEIEARLDEAEKESGVR